MLIDPGSHSHWRSPGLGWANLRSGVASDKTAFEVGIEMPLEIIEGDTQSERAITLIFGNWRRISWWLSIHQND
jgi:hypothetical protein